MESNNLLKSKTLSGLFWSFFERIGAHLVSFLVSIVLARLLLPSEYGIISIVLVFINICDVFVNSGFGQALVQKKDVDDVDFSSVFYFGLLFSSILYLLLFVTAPFIADFYDMEILSPVIRVMGLRIIIASVNSVQKAKVSRDMAFKKFFYATLGGTLFSAVIGIFLAYMGFGVWALVGQYISNTLLNTLILFVVISWRPKVAFSFEKMKGLFNYGWKILISSLIDVIYEDFRSLYVGKLYSANDLAYYTRGKQFPDLIVNNINSSITSVLFPAISKKQDNLNDVKAITRRAIKTSSYILTPLLLGLASVAEPLVLILLTDKWLPCVPFLQVLCINGALMPLQSANVQAINAVGRSDINLRLNIIKKSFGALMVLIFAQISVIAMAYAGIATGVVCLIVNIFPNRRLLNYGFFEQMKDIIPFWVMSGIMMMSVWAVSLLNLNMYLELALMVFVGAIVYILLSVLFKVESFKYILNTAKVFLKK